MPLFTLAEFIVACSKETFCIWSRQFVEKTRIVFQRAPIDEPIIKLTTTLLIAALLQLAHYSALVGHSRARRMYDLLQRDSSCTNTATEAYNTVGHCGKSPFTGRKFKYKRNMELFPPATSSKLVAINIFEPSPRTPTGN